MKRTFGLIICSGILLALSGCGTGGLNGAALPTARPILKVTSSSSSAQSNTSPAAAAPAAPDQVVAQDTSANNASTTSSPLPTPAAPLSGQSPAKSAQPQMAPGVMGTVTAVDGSMMTVQDSHQQSTVAVVLIDNTQVFKQATIALADVSVGETLSAMGSLNGDVFTAVQIRVGVEAAPANAGGGGPQPDGAGRPNGNPPDGGQSPSGGQPPAGGQPPSGNQAPANGQSLPGGQPLSGTITAVSGDTLTIETASDSTVQVQLAADGQMTRQMAGTSTDIVPGVQIMVRGEQSGTTITATRIDIVPAISQ